MHLKNIEKGVLLQVKVLPGSKINKLVRIEKERVYIKLAAQACENKANDALILMLSKMLRISKSSFQIIKGEKSREKTILILGKKLEDVQAIIEQSLYLE